MDINKIIKAAKAGGSISKKYFGEVLEIEEKSTVADFRTKADTEAEEAILKELQESFPGFNILSEEVGKIENGSEYEFVVDPLDGSNNFMLGIPNFSVSIALLKGTEIVAGVVYQPILDVAYHAEKGKGSFLDGKLFRVEGQRGIKKASISFVTSYVRTQGEIDAFTGKLKSKGPKRILENWSNAMDLCLLAVGKIDALVNDGNELYDFAAGKLIAREAGVVITDYQGSPDSDTNAFFIAAGSAELQAELVALFT